MASVGAKSGLEMAQKIKTLSPKTSALFLCDMQEKFRNLIAYFPQIITVSNRMLRLAQIMQMTVIATEQYPRGLGKTVTELELEKYNVPVFEKTCFSMVVDKVENHLREKCPSLKSVLLCGIETHACIYQTGVDLLLKGYDVHVIVDACSSRTLVDRSFAFRSLERMGAYLTTSECILFALLKDSSDPKFREIQKLIMEPSPDSGLLLAKL